MNETDKNYHWIQSYNFTAVIQGFHQQTKEILNVNYQGEIHLIIFENDFIGEIQHQFSNNNYLAGWLPTHNSLRSEYSFLLIPDIMMERDEVISKIPSFKDYIYLRMCLFEHPTNGEMIITLEEEIVEG